MLRRSLLALFATFSLLSHTRAQQPISEIQPTSGAQPESVSTRSQLAATKSDVLIPGIPTSRPAMPTPSGSNSFTPTWETQKGARTYMIGIPAPRGQIVDRNGLPLAQTRVSYNLALVFPTPLKFTE